MAIGRLFRSSPAPPDRTSSEQSPDLENDVKNPVDATNTQLETADKGGLSDDAPDGVKAARATTIVWSKNALILAYVLYVENHPSCPFEPSIMPVRMTAS